MILIHFKVQLDEYHSVKRDFKNCIRKLGDQQILILKLLTKNVEKFTEVLIKTLVVSLYITLLLLKEIKIV